MRRNTLKEIHNEVLEELNICLKHQREAEKESWKWYAMEGAIRECLFFLDRLGYEPKHKIYKKTKLV